MSFPGLKRKSVAMIGLCLFVMAAGANAAPLAAGTYQVSGSLDLDNGPYAPSGLIGTLVWDGTQIVPDGMTGTLITLGGTPESWSGPDWLGRIFGDETLEYASLSRPGSHELVLNFNTMRWGVSAPPDLDTQIYGGPLELREVLGGGGSPVPEPASIALVAVGLGLAALAGKRRVG